MSVNSEIKLQKLHLSKLNFADNEKFLSKDLGEIPVDVVLNSSFKLNEEKKIAKVSLELEIFPPGKDEKPFNLIIQYDGIFGIEKDHEIEVLIKFCEYNAPAIIFPYIREAISSVTAKSRYPRMNIPLMNLYGCLQQKAIKNKPTSKNKNKNKND